jgi:DNA-binding MarR family transcriptional regulator
MSETGSHTRWLSAQEQRYWRSWIAAVLLLPDQLSRDLQDQHNLTLADYEILVWLSESPDQQLRMSDLAERTLSSRSRLSHQVDRLEKAGIVERHPCVDDKRGSFAALTPVGTAILEAAAPDHVMSVRQHLVDVLTPEEFAALGSACQKVVDHLRGQEQAADESTCKPGSVPA